MKNINFLTSKNEFLRFIFTEDSLPRLKKPAIITYPEQQFSPHLHSLSL
jgi:hypothetical protein